MKRLLVLFALWISGWKHTSPPPDTPKYVAIAAPHTSNWDLVLAVPPEGTRKRAEY